MFLHPQAQRPHALPLWRILLLVAAMLALTAAAIWHLPKAYAEECGIECSPDCPQNCS